MTSLTNTFRRPATIEDEWEILLAREDAQGQDELLAKRQTAIQNMHADLLM